VSPLLKSSYLLQALFLDVIHHLILLAAGTPTVHDFGHKEKPEYNNHKVMIKTSIITQFYMDLTKQSHT
jgi:hypothetical protein